MMNRLVFAVTSFCVLSSSAFADTIHTHGASTQSNAAAEAATAPAEPPVNPEIQKIIDQELGSASFWKQLDHLDSVKKDELCKTVSAMDNSGTFEKQLADKQLDISRMRDAVSAFQIKIAPALKEQKGVIRTEISQLVLSAAVATVGVGYLRSAGTRTFYQKVLGVSVTAGAGAYAVGDGLALTLDAADLLLLSYRLKKAQKDLDSKAASLLTLKSNIFKCKIYAQ